MKIAQHPEHFNVGKETSSETIRPEDLAAVALRDTDLARALIQHICRTRATGYEDEIVVAGEIWAIEVRGKSPIS